MFPSRRSTSNNVVFLFYLELHDGIWQNGGMNRKMKKKVMPFVRELPSSRRKKRSGVLIPWFYAFSAQPQMRIYSTGYYGYVPTAGKAAIWINGLCITWGAHRITSCELSKSVFRWSLLKGVGFQRIPIIGITIYNVIISTVLYAFGEMLPGDEKEERKTMKVHVMNEPMRTGRGLIKKINGREELSKTQVAECL